MDSAHQGEFEFLEGPWHIATRRLVEPLTGKKEWEEFDGRTMGALHLDGNVSIDEAIFPSRGFSGLSIRLRRPQTGMWEIYWVNSGDGRLQPPVYGWWSDGTCELVGIDEINGRAILARYRWLDITGDSARWEQAFSTDAGRTWETNWIWLLTR